jgi:hypothetical protein
MNLIIVKKFYSAISLILLSLFAVSFLWMAIKGGIENYTSVPLGDMWDGYLEFYRRLHEGGLKIWWEQHNEHRIFLTRLLFWIDLRIFKGSVIFLIVLNYILAATISCVFILIAKTELKERIKLSTLICYSLFIIALSFSWMQMENFTWGFQSQFFLVFLLPMVAFYNLYKSSQCESDIKFFLISCIAGIASAGTMANGVLTLPIMTILSFILKFNKKKIVCLFSISLLVLFLYFYNFSWISYHASIRDSVFNHPLELLKYFFIYLGGPFYYLTRGREIVALLAGIFMSANFIYFIYINIKKNNSTSLQWVLLAFIFYIHLSISATAGARLGISSSLTSRYMTPALMAWSSLFILYALNVRSEYKLTPILILILWLLLPWQQRALIPAASSVFQQKLSALALQMQIKDQKQIPMVYVGVDRALTLSKFAIQNSLCIFGTSHFKEISNRSIGQIYPFPPNKKALGGLDSFSPIEGSTYVKVEGWMFEPKRKKIPPVIHFLDQNNRIVGHAFTGKSRSDLKKAISSKVKYAGFSGYMLADQVSNKITLLGKNPDCQLVIEMTSACAPNNL